MPVSLVTPSTSPATSSPNASRTSSRRRGRVLDGVVQQRGAQRLGVEPHAGADLRHADRMDDEVLARLAPLVGVVLAGEHERLDRRGGGRRRGDLVGVLLDDREQVGEQLALERREVGRRLGRRVVLVVLAVDGLVGRDGDAVRHRGDVAPAAPRPPPSTVPGTAGSRVVSSCWSAMVVAPTA